MPEAAHARAEITLRFLAAPTDAGQSGSVSAGRVLEWIDKAGYAAAAGWSGTYAVTAYVGNVRFTRPVEVGELVEVSARVVHTGRTSMHVTVDVASGQPATRVLEPATRCLMVFVSVDEHGASTPVRELVPRTLGEELEQQWAARRSELRSEVEAAMAEQVYSDAGTAPRVVMRFLAAPTDVNWGGKVHGGILMRWIDETGYVCASGWSGAHVVSRFSGGMSFIRPIRIGDLIEIQSRLVHTGRSSMHVALRVLSGSPRTGELALATQCTSVYVAVGDDGRPMPVPTWAPTSAVDIASQERALEFMALRADPAFHSTPRS